MSSSEIDIRTDATKMMGVHDIESICGTVSPPGDHESVSVIDGSDELPRVLEEAIGDAVFCLAACGQAVWKREAVSKCTTIDFKGRH